MQKIRKKLHKGIKVAGGLSVFVKQDLCHIVKYVPNINSDSIWVKIKKRGNWGSQDLYLGTVYLSPATKAIKNDSLEDLFEEVCNFKGKGFVLLQGDFNAHTSNNDDFLTYNKSDEMFGIANCEKLLMRYSEDRKPINERSSCLLDLCKTHDFLIVNGRKPGDVFGKDTSFQWNGCRVVDYLLASSPYFDKITKFQVGDFYPWLSDHCTLHYSISLIKHIDIKNAEEEILKVLPSRFLWEASSKTKFEEIHPKHQKVF